MKAYVWPILAVLGLAALPARAEEAPAGVYDCFGPSMAHGRSPEIWEGAGGGGTLNTAAGKFSIIGPGRYLSRDGKTGHFKFDGFTLSMVDGSYAGMRFHKVSDWSFRMLRDTGEEGPFMCPRNTAKDPRKPAAW